MFDLEQAILEWRRRMLAAGIAAPTPLEELESHLREEITRQSQSAVDARQAFESAVRKMGHAQALGAEFTKIGATQDARTRKFCIVSIIIIYGLFLIITVSVFLFKEGFDWGQRISGLAAGVLPFLLTAAGACLHRFFPAIVDRKRLVMIELAICVPFIAAVVVFMNFILPRLDLTVYQLAVVVIWALASFGLLSGLMVGLDEAGYRRKYVSPDR